MGSKRSAAVLCLAILGFAAFAPPQSCAQGSAAAAREKQIADRFLQVLLRRPRRGTALDRVYGYHIQAGTLDDLIAKQTAAAESGGDAAGAHYMLAGLLQLQRGSDAEAAESFAQAEKLRPEDAMASYHHGKSLLLIGRGGQAAEALERAIDRKPARAEALKVFTELGRLYQRAQETEKALAVWQRLEDAFPGDTRVGEQIAGTLAEEGQYAEALRRYEQLAEASAASNDYRAVGYRIAAAELKRQMGRDDEALEDFESLLSRLRPSSWLYADVRRRIEAGFLRTGDYAGLADYYAEQVEQKPDDIALRLRHGQTLAKAGRLNEAEAALAESVELAPEDADARLAMVDILKTAGKAAEAAGHLENLVEQDPENPDYLIQLGNTWLDAESLQQSERRDKAAEAWMRLAEARQDDAVATAQVADLMRRIERRDEALRLYRRAVELAPDQPQYREYLGEYLHRLDRKDEALQSWAAIAEGPRETRDNLIRLAEVLNTFEYPAKALEAFAKAAELDPEFSQRLRYSELLSRGERFEEALAQLEQADSIAETPEDREQLLRKRIDIYSSSGKLDQRIAETRRKAEEQGDAEAHRELALMLDAAARLSEATEAIEAAKAASPNDPAVLGVAAELYRKASRYADAIEAYQSLAKIDARFLPNYLKRITGLRMQLGQVEQALETAAELITVQPGNPEAYRFYAEQCFRVGRDEEGIEKLRQALRASSRDGESKRALAGALAERFRTDEAIELYWQLIDDTDELDEQEGLVSSLAELYERKGDYDRLLSRLELRGRELSDMRTATLLTAAAHRAVGDLGSARQTLQPLLAENPRDAELLRQMVSLSEAADDLSTATRYQEQLVALAGTPEHRRKLVGLMVDNGQIDEAEATLQRIRGLDDPVTMIGLIDRAMRRGENNAALRFCRTVLEQHPDLWEVRVRQAGLLLMSGEIDRAIEQADRVAALSHAADEKSEKEKASQTRPTRSSRTANPLVRSMRNSRLSLASQASRISSLFKIGRYSSYSYSSAGGASSALDPDNFGEARYLANAVQLAAASKQGKLEEVAEALARVDEVATATDVEQLWDVYHVLTLRTAFGPRTGNSATQQSEHQKAANRVLWRLAELDERERLPVVSRLLSLRHRQRNPHPSVDSEPAPPEPLDQRRLALAQKAYRAVAQRSSGSSGSSGSDLTMANALHEELLAADREAEAERLREAFPPDPREPGEAIRSLRFHASAQRVEDVTAALGAVRQRLPGWAADIKPDQASGLSQALLAALAWEDLPSDSRPLAVDLTVAAQTLAGLGSQPRRRSSQQDGIAHAYYYVDGEYQRQEIAIPFSQRLLPRSFAQQFYQSLRLGTESPQRDELVEYLGENTRVLTAESEYAEAEGRFRRSLSAFVHWWIDDAEGAYRRIVEASEAAPENNDLWIERARLAAELERPEASLKALDGISPLDHETLRVRELAALNLASRLGRLDRAKSAAQRLFGMRLDNNTEMALADQLNRLGMQEMATAVLQRSQRRGGQSTRDLLQLAQRYLNSDNSEAAAEVAFKALQKTSSGNERNASYYRRQAVELLQRAGRLDTLLQQAEERAAAAPKSLTLKTELAELYTAAGRNEDANKVLEEIAEQKPNDPKTLWSTGEQLASAGKHGAAVDKFLAAIQKQPDLLRNGYYDFERAVTSAKQTEKAFRALTEIDIARFDSYTLSRLTSLYRRGSDQSSEAANRFLRHLLEKADPEPVSRLLQDLGYATETLRSEAVKDAVRRILADDRIYQTQTGFWPGNTTSSGGRARGPLKPILTVLRDNDELREEARQRIARKAEGDDSSPLAELLLIAIDRASAEPQQIESRIRELMQETEDEIGYRVWWQLGIVVQEQDGLQDLAIAVLEHAREGQDPNRGSSYQFTVDARLTEAYVEAGHREKAREQLLRAYEQTDNSSQNRYNPGYGEYQDLQAYESIAQKLLEVDFPLDAVKVYADTLAQPQRFDAAKQWGGSRDYASRFEEGLEDALDQLSDDDFTSFLNVEPREGTADPSDEGGFDLVTLAASPGMDPAQSSIAAIVMTSLAKSDDGKKTLAKFDEQATERLQEHPGDRSLAAAAAMVATVLEQDDAAERLRALRAQVPEPGGEGNNDAEAAERTLALYSPVLIALGSNREAVRAEANQLADRLIEVAAAQEEAGISQTLTLAKIKAPSGSVDPELVAKTMRSMLANVVPPTAGGDEAKIVTTSMAQQCLRIAELSAEAGAWDVAMQALQRGFGGGPPLRTMDQNGSSSSAFVLPSNQRSAYSSSSRDDDNLDPLAERIAALIDSFLEDADGEPSTDDAELGYVALRNIVFPQSRPGEVFPYAVDLSKQRNHRFLTAKEDLEVPSVARCLALMAVKSGKLAEFQEFLDAQESTSRTPDHIELIRVHLGLANRDNRVTDQALREMAARLGIDVEPSAAPANDEQSDADDLENAGAQSSRSSRSTGSPGSPSAISEPAINVLLHAVLPAHRQIGATPVVAAMEARLIEQSARIQQFARVMESLSWLPADLLRCDHVTDEQARRVVNAFLSGIRLRYSNYSGDYGERQFGSRRAELTESSIRAGRWTLAGELLREFARENRGFQFAGTSFADFAIALSDAGPEQRYEVLSRMMFGKEGDAEPASTANLVLVAEPPSELRAAAKRLEQVRQVPLAHADFPVVSTALSLADAAAACGRTDELAARLRPQIQQPGDEVEAMLGLALLADGRTEPAAEIFTRVVKRVAETTPKKKVPGPMPIEASLLAARSITANDATAQIEQVWEDLLMHSRQRQERLLISLCCRVVSRLGLHPAAGATEASPLKHWISVQFPHHNKPVAAVTEPLFALRDGTLRYAAGPDQCALLFKYPLTGDFTFGHRNVKHPWGGSHNTYGGTKYLTQAFNDTVRVATLVGRENVVLPNESGHRGKDNLNEVEVTGDKAVLKVNGHPAAVDRRNDSMPFAGLLFKKNIIAEVADLKIEGDPVIPREVDLIEPQLRGWSCSILGGMLPDPHLPIAPNEDPAAVRRTRQQQASQASERKTWYADGDELKSGTRATSFNPGGQRHIQYQRPLLAGETISYEFFYEPGEQEVHPTIGRVAVLLRPSGVKLRWLPQSRSLESTGEDALHEIDPAEPLGEGKPELREGEWNAVKLTGEDSKVLVEVNGQPVGRFETARDQRFGLLGEKERSCRIRNIKLSGPWPETLPEDLMEKR